MEVSDSDWQKIRLVIEQQLAAFQQDDAPVAFSFASPDIQAKFVNPERFLLMVSTAYEAAYRPRSVIFEKTLQIDGYPTQTVLLMQANGDVVRAIYLMQPQTDLTWRIHGCFLESY